MVSCGKKGTWWRPCHVARACDDLIVVKETAAGQIARVAGQFATDSHVALAGLERIDGAPAGESACPFDPSIILSL